LLRDLAVESESFRRELKTHLFAGHYRNERIRGVTVSRNRATQIHICTCWLTYLLAKQNRDTYDEVSDDHCEQKERDADVVGGDEATPHGFDPLAAQDAEHDHECMEEIVEVPTRKVVFAAVVGDVRLAEQLFAHDGKDEDDDRQNEAQIAERSHRPSDDSDQQIQRRPRLGQLEHSQLNATALLQLQSKAEFI